MPLSGTSSTASSISAAISGVRTCPKWLARVLRSGVMLDTVSRGKKSAPTLFVFLFYSSQTGLWHGNSPHHCGNFRCCGRRLGNAGLVAHGHPCHDFRPYHAVKMVAEIALVCPLEYGNLLSAVNTPSQPVNSELGTCGGSLVLRNINDINSWRIAQILRDRVEGFVRVL